jgi:hypothetical protein
MRKERQISVVEFGQAFAPKEATDGSHAPPER